MKTITVNVSELVYQEFQEYARRHDRTAAELIRVAMEAYSEQTMRRSASIRALAPLDLGETISPLGADDDLLEELLHE